MKDTQFKQLIKEALTPDFLKESEDGDKKYKKGDTLKGFKFDWEVIELNYKHKNNIGYKVVKRWPTIDVGFYDPKTGKLVTGISESVNEDDLPDYDYPPGKEGEAGIEDRGDKWEIYFQETNEYPADTIARIASGPNVEVEWIRDSFDTITDDFGFDKVDLANGIVDGLIESGFGNADLVRQALEDYLAQPYTEGKKKLGEDRFEDIEHVFSGEENNKTPVLVDVWYSHHEEHGTGGVYKVIVHFDDESEETFYSLKDAEAKYDLEGVEREETEFDVS